MTFLRRFGLAVGLPLVVNVVLVYLGFPLLVSSFFSFVVFLWMNGVHYLRLVYRTLPRDLAFLRVAIEVLKKSNKTARQYPYISDVFQRTVQNHPDKIAILYESRGITFQQLDELSNKIANVLRSCSSIQRGDCVAVFMENSPEYVAVYIALSKLGVTGALINCNLKGKSLFHCIEVANCAGVFFDCDLSDALSEILPDLDPTLSQALFSVGGKSSISGANNLEDEMKEVPATAPPALQNKSAEDILCYIYTSGTTGLPKPCNIYHRRAITVGWLFVIVGKMVPEDVVYGVLPLYHTSGIKIVFGSMIIRGTTVVLRRKFSASNFANDCFKHKCTVFFYIGEICRYLLAQPPNVNDSKLQLRVCLGNGLREDIWRGMQARFSIPNIVEFYGSTEGNVFLGNLVNKPGAIGYKFLLLSFLQHFTTIKVDPESGEYVKDGNVFCVKAGTNEPGELIGRIDKMNPFNGYKDSTATKKKVICDVFKKGDRYFSTGDVVRIDEEGFIYFCDRTGDTFRWKGENVSTTEVENTINKVCQPKQVVVYGVQVPKVEGRAGMAAIEGTPDSVNISDLAEKLLQALPKYAVPVFIRFLPTVELTGTFKLKKVKLRKEGFDAEAINDQLYYLDFCKGEYVPLTREIYEKINDGTVRI